MYRNLLLLVLLVFCAFTVSAQKPVTTKPVTPKAIPVSKKDTAATSLKDTVEKPMVINAGKQVKIAVDTGKTKYVNLGKIAGRRAAISSLMVPGLGQIRNGITVYRLAKVAGIYTGATLLTLSFIDNNKNYHLFYDELIYRRDPNNKGQTPSPGFPYTTDMAGLITAKDTFRRNKEVIIFSFVGLYLLNVVEAYIDARLKYFDVGDVAFKVSPAVINTDMMYGFNQATPGIKLTLSF